MTNFLDVISNGHLPINISLHTVHRSIAPNLLKSARPNKSTLSNLQLYFGGGSARPLQAFVVVIYFYLDVFKTLFRFQPWNLPSEVRAAAQGHSLGAYAAARLRVPPSDGAQSGTIPRAFTSLALTFAFLREISVVPHFLPPKFTTPEPTGGAWSVAQRSSLHSPDGRITSVSHWVLVSMNVFHFRKWGSW